LPYESITEEEYLELKKNTPNFNEGNIALFEDGFEFEIDDGAGCDSGHCPVR